MDIQEYGYEPLLRKFLSDFECDYVGSSDNIQLKSKYQNILLRNDLENTPILLWSTLVLLTIHQQAVGIELNNEETLQKGKVCTDDDFKNLSEAFLKYIEQHYEQWEEILNYIKTCTKDDKNTFKQLASKLEDYDGSSEARTKQRRILKIISVLFEEFTKKDFKYFWNGNTDMVKVMWFFPNEKHSDIFTTLYNDILGKHITCETVKKSIKNKELNKEQLFSMVCDFIIYNINEFKNTDELLSLIETTRKNMRKKVEEEMKEATEKYNNRLKYV